MSINPPASNPLPSQFSNDPEMRDIVGEFVSEMPQRIEELTASWASQELNALQRMAHQLKGAGGGYGYPAVSKAAGGLEAVIDSMASGSSQATVEELRGQFEELVSLCRRITV